MQSSNLLDRATGWLTSTQHSLMSFSILRIIYGIALLFILLPSWRDRALLWGHASFWVDPEASRRGYDTFDLLFPKDAPGLFDLAYIATIGLTIVFILGWRTRFVTPVLLIMYVSLQSNNGYVLNGGDTLMRITLIFLIFVNLSGRLSLDARRHARRANQGRAPRTMVPAYVSNALHNGALVLCAFQIMVVYATSGVWKLLGDEWLDGTALFYALRIDIFMTYPVLNELLWQSSLVMYVATFIALWTQTLFPLLIVWRPTRRFAVITLMFMHLGIAVLLGLWPFSLAMIALDMLFIRDESWSRAGAWVRQTRLFAAILAAVRSRADRLPFVRVKRTELV